MNPPLFGRYVEVKPSEDPWNQWKLVSIAPVEGGFVEVAKVAPGDFYLIPETQAFHKSRLTMKEPASGAVLTNAENLYFKLFGTDKLYV